MNDLARLMLERNGVRKLPKKPVYKEVRNDGKLKVRKRVKIKK